MKTNPSFTAGLAASLALLLAGCGHKEESGIATPLPVASVKVAEVEKKSRKATEEVMGTVRAKLRASIQAKVTGKIERMLVTPGQAVKAGELLAELDAREIQARLDQALALRQQAESDLRRFTALLEAKSLTQVEFDGPRRAHASPSLP
jgi:multidrug efflux pump subunit AcrA (membrane-fusion protein)